MKITKIALNTRKTASAVNCNGFYSYVILESQIISLSVFYQSILVVSYIIGEAINNDEYVPTNHTNN